MKPTSIRIIFDYRGTATRSKAATVYMEILHDRKRRYFNTGVRVCSHQWHNDKMVVNHPDSVFLNQRINSLRAMAEAYVNKCVTDHLQFSFNGLEAFISVKGDRRSFIEYMETRIEERNLRPNTLKNHRSSLRVLKEFKKIDAFSDLTPENIRAYDAWLHRRYSSQTSIHFHHKELKVYINEAIRAGLITQNPYDMVPIRRGKSVRRKFLEEAELEVIKSAQMPTASLSQIRDLFVFQCYTGLAYADLARFDFSKVIERRGKYIIRDARQKTDEIYYLVLLTPAIEILKKYDFKLPLVTNQQYNLRLKAVADYAGLGKNLTTHMARHTFAGIAINNGISIEILAQMMGHSDIKTTQIYAKIFNSTVESAFDTLERRLK